jgi:6-phosphogluconolactonase
MINIFSTPYETVKGLAEFISGNLNARSENGRKFTIALSGGSTPNLLYEVIRDEYLSKINWKQIDLYWGDERCVDPENTESNFGTAKRILLDFLSIPDGNIHRIRGESDPENEAVRYSNEIEINLPKHNGLPSFDLILLGIGTDGHTASIFPNQMHLINADKICDTAFHPETNQKRITITGKVIDNAENVVFLATGDEKAEIISNIIRKKDNFKSFPAAYINPKFGKLSYYLDKESAKFL